MAGRLRRASLPRRRVVVVGQPVRARPSAHQRRAARAARRARARHPRRVHAPRRGRALRAPRGPRPARPGSRLLRLGRRFRHGDRAQDELPRLGEPWTQRKARLREPGGELPWRNARRAVGHRRAAVPRHLCTVAADQCRGAFPRCADSAPRRVPTRRGRAGGSGAGGASRAAPRVDRRPDRRAAGAGRDGHGDARSALPRARQGAVHALRGAPDRRRDHDRVRPHRIALRLRAGGHRARLPAACRRESPLATCRWPAS